jgi:hypothetical protein
VKGKAEYSVITIEGGATYNQYTDEKDSLFVNLTLHFQGVTFNVYFMERNNILKKGDGIKFLQEFSWDGGTQMLT